MQSSVNNMESLEQEVIKKVQKQFEQLKVIIDDQRVEAETVIKNLESVKDYKPPPSDMTQETLGQLQ